MSQYNKLSNIQYARFQILPLDLNFGLFWSAGIPTIHYAHIHAALYRICHIRTELLFVEGGMYISLDKRRENNYPKTKII